MKRNHLRSPVTSSKLSINSSTSAQWDFPGLLIRNENDKYYKSRSYTF